MEFPCCKLKKTYISGGILQTLKIRNITFSVRGWRIFQTKGQKKEIFFMVIMKRFFSFYNIYFYT